MGRLWHRSPDRTPGVVEGGEKRAGPRPRRGHHATVVSGPGRHPGVYREGGGVLRLSGNRGAAAPRLPGLRGEAGEAEVPLPDGSLRVHLCRSAPLLPGSGNAGGCLRPDRADCPCRPGPADLHPDPALQPVLEAELAAPQCAGADLQPPGDNDFGFERHFLRGRSRVTARVGLALTVMMALALAQARAGRRQRMRSLVGAVPYADTG